MLCRSLTWWVCLPLLWLGACTFRRTQTIVEIRADALVQSEATELRLEVRQGDALVFSRSVNPRALEFPGFPVELPISARGGDANKIFELRAVALASRTVGTSVVIDTLAQNRVRGSFLAGQVLRVPLWLLSGCLCSIETERCVPDRDGDGAAECDPLLVETEQPDSGLVDANLLEATVDSSDIDLRDTSTDTGALDAPNHDSRTVDGGPVDGSSADASVDTICAAPSLQCGGVCVACPTDANADGFRCNGASCVLSACRTGFLPNANGTACEPQAGPWVFRADLTLATRPASFSFGSGLAVSANGLVLAVADDNYRGTGDGAVLLFTRASSSNAFTAAPVQFLTPETLGQTTFLGRSLALSADALSMAVGTSRAEVRVYRRSSVGTQFGVPSQTLSATGVSGFGQTLAMSPDATFLLAGAFDHTIAFYSRASASGTFAPEPAVSRWNAVHNSSAALSVDGLTLIIGDKYFSGAVLNSHIGRITRYVRASVLVPFVSTAPAQTIAETATGALFGAGVALSGDALTLAVGAPGSQEGDAGRVLVYRRANTTANFGSTPEQVLTGPAGSVDFGSSVALRADGRELFVADVQNGGYGRAVSVFTRP